MRVIAVEEHFDAPGFPSDGVPRPPMLYELGGRRIEAMDRLGVDIQVLSLLSPGVQAIADRNEAVAKAGAVNDLLAEACARHPTRLAGFAALPTQDPAAAANELERCVRDFGFKGCMVNGHTNGHYLNEDRFLPLWERAAALDVPIYLHPAMPFRPWEVFDGFDEFRRAAWGWTAETGAHALRVVGSGIFERLPNARMILGHMGEMIPYVMPRIDSRTAGRLDQRGLRHAPSHYIRRNVMISTSGIFHDAPLRCAIDMLGPEAVMFSADFPMDNQDEAMGWIAGSTLPAHEIEAVAHGNAERVLRL